MSWENYPPEPPQMSFPLYRSTDYGVSWAPFSAIHDTVNGWGIRYQPQLYRLTEEFGGYPEDTILAAGVSTPQDLSEAYIDLYASTDDGLSWKFVSHIAYGAGPETTANGDDAAWEPFFLMYKGELACFYSDQRDPDHAQKLVHVTTNDPTNWSDPVDDVSEEVYDERPKMTTVAHIRSTDEYMMTYELCGPQNCNAYYKVASSPLEFASVEGNALKSNDNSATVPTGSPYVMWTPHPQRSDGSGLIIVNAASHDALFINEDPADVNG